MGKFLKYESSNYRTFAIDTTASKIKRPNRVITAADLLGAVIGVDDAEAIIIAVEDKTTTIDAVYTGSDGEAVVLTYTKATNVFTTGSGNDLVTYTNIMINEFGGEQA